MKTITMVEIVCVNCGTTFHIDETLKELRQNDGGNFHCPNGHILNFTSSNKSKLDKALKELTETKQELHEAQVEIRQFKCELLKKPEGQTILQRLGLS